jgi:hypothetical protein
MHIAAFAQVVLVGMVVLAQPAEIKLVLPKGIAEDVAEDAPIKIETLWRPSAGEPMRV